MDAALPLATAGDPRLEPITLAVLERARLETSWSEMVQRLATGEERLGPASCCGSGCHPCVKDLDLCVTEVLRAYHDPAREASLLASRHGPVRKVGRLVLGALRKLRGD